RRNFGKAAALNAGFNAARGETIVTLDADLQDDPREIPKLLGKLRVSGKSAGDCPNFAESAKQNGTVPFSGADLSDTRDQGCDVVSGWKQVRYDPWHKVLASRVFNWLVGRMTGVWLHDHNCGMKAYRREIFDEVRLYGELHRFVPVLANARGFRVGEVVIQHRPRKYGRSKYGFARFVKGFLDLLTVKFL